MFWIDIADHNGTLQGNGPIATGISWRYRQRLNRMGEWSLEVPLGEPKLAAATLKRRLQCFAIQQGKPTWFGGGSLEDLRVSLQGRNVPTVSLSGADILQELTGIPVKFEVDYSAFPGSGIAVLSEIMSQVGGGWSFTFSGTVPELVARFVHESALNAFVTSCDKMGLMFRLASANSRTIHVFNSAEVTDIIAVYQADPISIEGNVNACLITSIERQQSSWQLINRYIVYGAGDGEARLTLGVATQWPDGSGIVNNYNVTDLAGTLHTFSFDRATNTIQDTASVLEFGSYSQAIAFKEIAPVSSAGGVVTDIDMQVAANTLVLSAINKLITSSRPQEQYQLSVTALRRELLPGQKLRVIAQKYQEGQPLINIDKYLLVLETETQIDTNGVQIVGLTVSTSREFAKDDATILMEQIQQARAFEAHPQIGPSSDTLTYREEIDFDHAAAFPFWISNGVVEVKSVTLRFRIEPLRSTVKAQGGSVTGTVDLPDHQHSVSVPSHSHSIDSHDHRIFLSKGSNPFDVTVDINDQGFGFLGYNGGGGDPATVRISTNEQDGGETSATSGGSTPTTSSSGSGTVDLDLSSAISTVYGVYEDEDTATYGVAAITWSVNAVPVAEAPTVLFAGWYELDITNYVTNAAIANRPLLYNNSVGATILTKEFLPGQEAVPPEQQEEKRVRVTAQIELRTTIQSVALV